MDQDRNTKALQHQRQKRGQIGPLARPIVRGQDNRTGLHGRTIERMDAGVHGPEKTGHFIARLALHAQGKHDRPKFEVGHASIEDGGIQLLCLFPAEVRRSRRTTPDLLDIQGKIHRLLHGSFSMTGSAFSNAHAIDSSSIGGGAHDPEWCMKKTPLQGGARSAYLMRCKCDRPVPAGVGASGSSDALGVSDVSSTSNAIPVPFSRA